MSVPDLRIRLAAAAAPHVPFDGWSDATFDAACADAGVDPVVARQVCPRGAIDLAAAAHEAGDAALGAKFAEAMTEGLRYSEKVALAVRLRIEAAGDPEVVRRSSTLFALPQNAAEGARLIWNTADTIWSVLGDTSRDVNWYSKRAILSGVYGSTVLYWLGDTSEGSVATWEFLNRRIDDVMRFEKLKAGIRDHPALSRLLSGPLRMLDNIRAPEPRSDLPGWRKPEEQA